jgi:hypothetical protein
MLVVDAARPAASKVMPQSFWFSESFERIASDVLDQLPYALGFGGIGIKPKAEVLPTVGSEFDPHPRCL